MFLQINVHAYNEAPTIGAVIQDVPDSIPGVIATRIVVVDDGSTDGTADVARAAGAEVIGWRSNRGLGHAYRAGLEDALRHGADLLVTVDGDGQFNTRDISRLVEPILNDEADMATCSRFADARLIPRMPRAKLYGNRILARAISLLTGRCFTDVSCGFRAYNRDCLLRLNLMGEFTYTHEVLMEMAFKGLRIAEVALPVRGVREHGESRMASSLPAYGWRAFRIIMGTMLNHQPHRVFGAAAVVSFVLGTVCSTLGAIPWLLTGTFFKALMMIGGFCYGMTVLLVLFGLQSRTLKRNHFLLETILFEMKRSHPTSRIPRERKQTTLHSE